MRAEECVCLRRHAKKKKKREERRAETEIDIVVRHRQEKQGYRENKTNLT